ncbi:hypothetical protein F5B22DRAFT_401308 [Xylaria bambusicola]|uniref:uncharacterized protein n=1 Tax=Xylaria bambusicola TaxID=326684 RepID=UPI002007FC2B|nr:uncharacterized protein F5B22DRAFT_401308 [Xylaria bambusicola]KAI0508348.1 hypothetical protein F5B22DRAFT_401308 [Xylaria bambusicola]
MAVEGASSGPETIPFNSHDTALCVLPPKRYWPLFDGLRRLYDKGYEKWPPHINLVYPYVQIENLSRASEMITSVASQMSIGGVKIRLAAADVFSHKHDNTIFVYDNDDERIARLYTLRQAILTALGQTSTTGYRMHMTIGQSEELNSDSHKFLLEKASLLPEVEWTVDKLCIMVRERRIVDGNAFSQMRVWGTIDLTTFSLDTTDSPEQFNQSKLLIDSIEGVSEAVKEDGSLVNFPYTLLDGGKWGLHPFSHVESSEEIGVDSLSVASYNVLAEFKYPPLKARYPLLVQNILQEAILADILILQEVTDDFLSFICHNNDIRKHYRFVSHGPPDQDDIGPLPNHLNVVVLSRCPFSWTWLSFNRRHKGSMIVTFRNIGKQRGDTFVPVILSTIHLTSGLNDGSVSSKKQELQALLTHLTQNYSQNPWILAGDFNITTSTHTIEAAFRRKEISSQTIAHLSDLENSFNEARLIDAWASARVQYGDHMDLEHDFERQVAIYEGEQGATFDPTINDLAAESVGSGFNNRPQRYDRILVSGEDFIVTNFDLFGRRPGCLDGKTSENASEIEGQPMPFVSYASDHWGVRCSLKFNKGADLSAAELSVPVHLSPAQDSLSDTSQLKSCLGDLDVFPSEADITRRKEGLELLKDVVLEHNSSTARGNPSFVLVPVGSYGLGVWTASSDIDCLCIGPISAKTFFTLATQRIRKAEDKGIRLRRRVNAHSGTMLELEVLGIKMDLQYCPSAAIAEAWPHVMRLPAKDPMFALPVQTLAKLKPVRDMYYIRRTIPDYAAFRTAYHLIRYWAKQRGIYSAKFGMLSGIQISVLLTRVCKLLSHGGRIVPLPSILTTFFHHYANFNWNTQLAFDPFFHKQLRYVRTAREPMAILGFYPPSLNTALNASLPSVSTISNEFKRASTQLSQQGTNWTVFLSETQGFEEFLASYKTFVKIDVQFWGVSLAKGSSYVGWLESRCVMLLVDLNRRVPNIHARIWPARFVNEDVSDNEADYQGSYLIGLTKFEGTDDENVSKDEMKTTLGSLRAALQKFEAQIRGDEKYFDSTCSWMSASLTNRSELGRLQLDSREWGDYTIGDDDFDDEEEEEDEISVDSDDEEHVAHAGKSKSKKKKNLAFASHAARPAYIGKFRSSSDVINRIRWDPHMDSGDYIVGYEDRFLGTKERALDAWKSEQTDEEFIPQHRILYFKRKSDGVIVWDRKERRDTVFGSGISSINVK